MTSRDYWGPPTDVCWLMRPCRRTTTLTCAVQHPTVYRRWWWWCVANSPTATYRFAIRRIGGGGGGCAGGSKSVFVGQLHSKRQHRPLYTRVRAAAVDLSCASYPSRPRDATERPRSVQCRSGQFVVGHSRRTSASLLVVYCEVDSREKK